MEQFEQFTVDTGHSFWKVFWRNKQYMLPALVASGPLREQVNGIFETDYSSASIDNIHIETPFGYRYVGNLAKVAQATPWSAFDRAKYARAEFMLPMLLGAMSEAKVTGDTVVIVTAVPGEWAKDEKVKTQIENQFLTTHTVKRDGRRGEKQINVSRVEVLSETGGLLYSHLLNSDGHLTDEDYPEKRYAVIDIGEHTTCVDLFSGLNKEGKTRSYSSLSMGQIHEEVGRQITAQTGRHLEPWAIRDVVMGSGYILHTVKGQSIRFDIMPLYQAEVSKAQDQLYSIGGQIIKNAADVSHILIGGGGSSVLGPVLSEVYPQAMICGQWATGQGLHNYGRRLCDALNNR